MTTWQPDLAPVADRIPRLFHLMKAIGDAAHAEQGVNAASSAVLGALVADGPQTVPAMARAWPASRQYIQSLVNDLMSEGLVEARSNPAHRRSSLIALTERGARTAATLKVREAAMLSMSARAVSAADVAATLRLFDVLERDFAAQASTSAGPGRR